MNEVETIEVDLQGYLAGDNVEDCITEVFDLDGRRIP